jgi:predicted amidohydrolase YtcJ
LAPATPVIPAADVILKNGKVITVDAAFTIVQAIAIAGDRIVAVGPDAAMAAHTSPATRIVDLKGKAVIPGVTDGHAHMDREGLREVFPALGRVRSIGDIQERIAELARAKRPGEWIVTMPIGDPPYYFNVPDILAEKRWPTRQELDAAAPNNPVYIRSIWGYWRGTLPIVSCANTEALKRAGVTRDTATPIESVQIEKDSNGDPTGIFIEHEMSPIAELIWFREAAGFTHTHRLETLPKSARAYHGFGTTSVFEGHGVATEILQVYKEAHRNSTLTMRATLALSPNWRASGGASVGPLIEAWAGWLGEPGIGDDWLKMSGIFIDAGYGPGDRVRERASPYTGWGGYSFGHGLTREQAKEVLLHCAANNIRPIMIGADSLDLYAQVDREIPINGRRWVLSHVRTLSPADIERVARMGIVITTQTNNALYKGLHTLARQLPPERHEEIVPMRSLLDAGVVVSLGTDNTPISPFNPIWQTIARTSFHTKERVAPKQALTRADALRCATSHGAYLTFDENKKGMLQAGKLADLAVLSDDPLTVEESHIQNITSLMTMVGGKIVHEAANWID